VGRKKLPRVGSGTRTRRDAPHDRPIYDYVRTRIPTRPKRGDLEAAVSAAAKHFNRHQRTIERAVKRCREVERLDRAAGEVLAVMRRDLAFVRRWLTTDEIEELGDAGLPTLGRIARDREELAELRKLVARSVTRNAPEKPIKRRISRR